MQVCLDATRTCLGTIFDSVVNGGAGGGAAGGTAATAAATAAAAAAVRITQPGGAGATGEGTPLKGKDKSPLGNPGKEASRAIKEALGQEWDTPEKLEALGKVEKVVQVLLTTLGGQPPAKDIQNCLRGRCGDMHRLDDILHDAGKGRDRTDRSAGDKKDEAREGCQIKLYELRCFCKQAKGSFKV